MDITQQTKQYHYNNATRQGTFQKLITPKWDLVFSKYKLSYRAVRSFNLLPLEARNMTKGQFKNFAKAHILENIETYRKLTREFNVVGKIKTPADPLMSEKIKEMKRLSHTHTFTHNISNKQSMNSPMRRAGTSKFWIPAPTTKRLCGLRLQAGTPSKVPSDLVNVQNARNQLSNNPQPGCSANKKVARALARLF